MTTQPQAISTSPFGPQEPPNDPRIFNRRQPDGTFRPLSEFFAEPFKNRAQEPADVAAYLERDAFTSHAAEEAPLAWNAPVQPELAVLDAPDSVEWIEADDFVRIERLVRRADAPAEYGTVLRVNAAVQYAPVQFEGMDKSEWFSIDEVYLVSKAGALETAGAVASV